YGRQPRQQPDGETEGREYLSHHENHAKDRGPPLRIERHDKINGEKGDAAGIKHNTKAAQVLDADKLRRSGHSSFFLFRPGIQAPSQKSPNGKEDQGANNSKRMIQ